MVLPYKLLPRDKSWFNDAVVIDGFSCNFVGFILTFLNTFSIVLFLIFEVSYTFKLYLKDVLSLGISKTNK